MRLTRQGRQNHLFLPALTSGPNGIAIALSQGMVSPTFSRILDSPLSELYRLREGALGDPAIAAYVDVLIASLEGRRLPLARALAQIQSLSQDRTTAPLPLVQAISALRLQVVSGSIDQTSLHGLAGLFQPSTDPAWLAEGHVILGSAYEILEDHFKCQQHCAESARLYHAAGAPRKALRARFNALAAESRSRPYDSFIPQYRSILRDARRAKVFGIAGAALLAISRELQAVGALSAALTHANRAVACMSRDAGSIHAFHAIVHRAHLSIDMGRSYSAWMDFEMAKLSSHPANRAAVQQLEQRLTGGSFDPHTIAGLTHGWKFRIKEAVQPAPALAPKEEELIRLLTSGPRSKLELITALWGRPSHDRVVFDDRFRKLLARIDRKCPGFIVRDGKRYRIASAAYLEQRSKKAAG